MHKRRALILEEVLAKLNPKVYNDVFHFVLRELAEIYEKVYKLKVCLLSPSGFEQVRNNKLKNAIAFFTGNRDQRAREFPPSKRQETSQMVNRCCRSSQAKPEYFRL